MGRFTALEIRMPGPSGLGMGAGLVALLEFKDGGFVWHLDPRFHGDAIVVGLQY